MTDPYRILNLRRDASAAEIKSAYRRLAKELHPDRNPGDQRAEQRFREVGQAYEILSDPEKRQAFDRGLIDGDGKPRAGFNFGFGGGGGGDARGRSGFESIFEKAFGGGFSWGPGAGGAAGQQDLNSAFEELLKGRQSGRPGGGAGNRTLRGADLRSRVEVDFMTAARGGRERVTLKNGRVLEVDLPPGTHEGQVLRLRGQGHPSPSGGPAGDALVEIRIRPHPRFRRSGHDLHVDLPVSLSEALLGAKVKVPTIDGAVRVSIAPGANSGQTLRLRGKGLAHGNGSRGDQLVRLVVMLPDATDRQALNALRRVAEEHPYEVRREVETA
ncbi:MAG: J domain-containing protein [Geminicoccaceae bacterium]|nr:J domain-containing protein [Geminicoccaceae bacterium]